MRQRTHQSSLALRAFAACLIGALALGACGDKRHQSGDADAAEVTPPVRDTAGGATAPSVVVAGPASFAQARTAFKDRRYDEAVRLFTLYTGEHPDSVSGYYMLGLAAWKAGDRVTAVNAFQLALEKDSTHVKSHLNLARVLIEQGQVAAARPHVDAVLERDSTSPDGYRLLGRVKGVQGDTAGAITAYQRAIVLDSADAWSLNNLARLYSGQGRFVDAIGPLARAIAIDSTVATFQNNLGMVLERTGHITQATEAYRAALALDSTSRKVSVNLTRVSGLKQDPALTPVDLGGAARGFVEQVKSWR
ncbi:MAG TPA: tetratricopeptide repeat protein [Gemmatimonadales bacterium]|nr:tetratricopeptide repeat protein [Gemmatimonadales bacterium]